MFNELRETIQAYKERDPAARVTAAPTGATAIT